MQSIQAPIAGVDYPRTFQEFEAWFPDEQACHRYLCRLRWPQGFVCPSCKAPTPALMTGRGLLHCPQCQAQSSVTGGTLLQGTRKPLRTWLLTIWFVTGQKSGASALGRSIRLRRTPDASARGLLPFIQDSVAPGADILTDGWELYKALPKLGYVHQAKVIRGSGKQASQLLPGVHRVASLLKRWLLGTHHCTTCMSCYTSARAECGKAARSDLLGQSRMAPLPDQFRQVPTGARKLSWAFARFESCFYGLLRKMKAPWSSVATAMSGSLS